jgi:putative ABC transport system permease protein
MAVAGIGMTLGITGAMVASRALVTMLYGVTRLDVPAYAGVIVLLAGVSAIACGMPAWRAAKIRPSIALRSE